MIENQFTNNVIILHTTLLRVVSLSSHFCCFFVLFTTQFDADFVTSGDASLSSVELEPYHHNITTVSLCRFHHLISVEKGHIIKNSSYRSSWRLFKSKTDMDFMNGETYIGPSASSFPLKVRREEGSTTRKNDGEQKKRRKLIDS